MKLCYHLAVFVSGEQEQELAGGLMMFCGEYYIMVFLS